MRYVIDERELLKGAAREIAPPEDVLGRLDRRRMRRRRNERIAAGAVGGAIFVAIVVVAAAVSSVGDQVTPAGSGPTIDASATSPAIVQQDPYEAGFVGLPPEGAEPSTPESGTLTDVFGRGTLCQRCFTAWLFEDGRLIWVQNHVGLHGTTGLLEQRLTSEGVQLLLAEMSGIHPLRQDGLLLAMLRDPLSVLPTSAWADPTIRAFVPSGFRACAPDLSLLPAGAQAQLMNAGRVVAGPGGLSDDYCADVTTDRARAIVADLEAAGFTRFLAGSAKQGLVYTSVPDSADNVAIGFDPLLPNGDVVYLGFG